MIKFAKKEKMGSDVISGLSKYIKLYKVYKKLFFKKEYLASTTLVIDGNEVKQTEEDVDRLRKLKKYYDGVIDENDKIIKQLKADN